MRKFIYVSGSIRVECLEEARLPPLATFTRERHGAGGCKAARMGVDLAVGNAGSVTLGVI